MQQFFVTADQVQENQIYIEGTDVNHMKNVASDASGMRSLASVMVITAIISVRWKIRGCTRQFSRFWRRRV